MDELTLEDSIGLLLGKAPRPVQDFVLNELSQTARDFMVRHNMRVDQAGVFERELLLMLVGQESPVEFVKALEESGMPHDAVQRITADVNERVFKRLRQEERQAGAVPAAPKPTVPAQPEWVTVNPPTPDRAPVPEFLPGAPVPPAAQPPAPPPPPTPAAAPQPPASISVGEGSGEPLVHPHVRTMAGDMELAKAGIEIHYEEEPARPQASAPPPPPSVSVIPPREVPATPPQPPAPPPYHPPAGGPHIKSYAVDPYREPIE